MKMKIELESQEEREVFERMPQHPSREQLMAEVAVLTELVRVLSDRVAELEGASNTLNEMRRRYDDHFAKALGVKK
jgi:hypothetical protein